MRLRFVDYSLRADGPGNLKPACRFRAFLIASESDVARNTPAPSSRRLTGVRETPVLADRLLMTSTPLPDLTRAPAGDGACSGQQYSRPAPAQRNDAHPLDA